MYSIREKNLGFPKNLEITQSIYVLKVQRNNKKKSVTIVLDIKIKILVNYRSARFLYNVYI